MNESYMKRFKIEIKKKQPKMPKKIMVAMDMWLHTIQEVLKSDSTEIMKI